MKTKILTLALIVGMSVAVSCSSTEADNAVQEEQEAIQEEMATDPLDGIWNLKTMNGGVQGVTANYNLGQVIWIFDSSNSILTVQDNTTDSSDHPYVGIGNGTYDFDIVDMDGEQILSISSIDIGVIVITADSLILNNSEAADGFVTAFER